MTLDVFERGCLLLGLDPDAVLAGHVDPASLRRPPLARGARFLKVVLENGEAYDLASMEPVQVDALLGVVTAHFIWASTRSSRALGHIRSR